MRSDAYTEADKDKLSKCLGYSKPLSQILKLFPDRNPQTILQALYRFSKAEPVRFDPNKIGVLSSQLYRKTKKKSGSKRQAYDYSDNGINLVEAWRMHDQVTANFGYELRAVDLFGWEKIRIYVAEEVDATQFRRDLLNHVLMAAEELEVDLDRRRLSVTYSRTKRCYVLQLDEKLDLFRNAYLFVLDRDVEESLEEIVEED